MQTEEAQEILLNLDKVRDYPLALRAAVLAKCAFDLEKQMDEQMPTEMRRKMGKISLFGALYQPESYEE